MHACVRSYVRVWHGMARRARASSTYANNNILGRQIDRCKAHGTGKKAFVSGDVN
jgi:hypothetical protein